MNSAKIRPEEDKAAVVEVVDAPNAEKDLYTFIDCSL
jgi:hypothetical protein